MSKENQEAHPSYMDGVKVKIAENYKPPPRISLPMSSSQRLSLNAQIQESIPSYDFALEKTVKDRVKEWRSVRGAMADERRKRLDKLKEARDKIKSQMALEINEEATKYPSNREVLIPTQVTTNYANMMTPTPLGTQPYVYAGDKSPFNISDFEADTSSPFDNMELKTINDMAELALVLQSDDKNFSQGSYAQGSYVETYPNYNKPDTGQNRTYAYQSQPATSASTYMQATNSVYTTTNGYYYDTFQPSALYAAPYSYKTELFDANIDDNKLPVSDVPNIMKALETEITNADHKKPILIPKARVEAKNPKMDEPYASLPKNLQELAENISGMGFPLERVARVCKLLGDDNKKVVEHLLVMSDLLDLGFQEGRVSDALMQCNNDRDKALDLLIS